MDENGCVMGGLDTNTKLLAHFDSGVTAETGQTLTFVGTAQLDTTDKKFGTASLLLNGSTDAVTVPNSTDWNFGTGDFTVDAWIKCLELPTALNPDKQIFNQYVDALNRTEFKLQYSGGAVNWRLFSTGGVAFSQVANISTGIWYHVAWVRSGNSFYFFQDGVPIGSVYSSASAMPSLATTFNIGWATAPGGFWNGKIEEVRVSKGVARWVTNFTPPIYPYTNYQDIGLRIRKGSTNYIIPGQALTTQKLRIRKGSTTYGIPLVNTGSDFDGGLRIYEGSTKAVAMETV